MCLVDERVEVTRMMSWVKGRVAPFSKHTCASSHLSACKESECV
jgi:hypothetical protein